MTPTVLVTRHDGVVQLVLNRPERRNALSIQMLTDLSHALIDARGATAVVLTGTGNFSAGADLADLTGTLADRRYDDLLAATISALGRIGGPVIAALEGSCVGAAVDLALAADTRIGGSSAWMQVPAVQLGLLYNPGSIARWHRLLPRTTLNRLLVIGERIGGDQALAAGLISQLTPDGQAVQQALAIANRVSGFPLEALRQTKRLLSDLEDGPIDPNHWQHVRDGLLQSPERQQAVAAARQRHGLPQAKEST